MARYLSTEQAEADGFSFVFEPESDRFAVYRGEGDERRLLGEAHYTLLGEVGSPGAAVDFDHTVVSPDLRGTGIGGLLAQRALTSEIPRGRAVRTSCWFIEGYLAKHPDLLG